MIYVGIDVAKDKHDCFITKPHKETADCNNKKVRKAGQVGERP